jgi:hypothetical protein
MTKPDAGSLAGLLRDVLRSHTDRPRSADSDVTQALRDVLLGSTKLAPRPAAGRKARKSAGGKATRSDASATVSRLKLARSLAEVRTNIIAADKMTPMQKLRTTQLANELAARLRKLP